MNLIRRLKLTAFHTMWITIALISLIDLILAIWLLDPSRMEYFRAAEQNPMVVKLVELTGDMSLFIFCKIVGTIASVFIGKKVFEHNEKWGLSVAGGVLTFQLWLLYYLLYGTP